MNILVKGMEMMPKVCADCPFRVTMYDPGYYYYEKCKASGRIFNECRLDIDPFEEKLNDCPLDEIVTCGECRWFDDGGWGFGHCERPFVGHLSTAEYGFCSYGERRSDDNN